MEGMKGCDRVCYPLGCGQHESWAVYYVLDGKRCETYDAVDYMNEQGFTTDEARAYLRVLPKAGR